MVECGCEQCCAVGDCYPQETRPQAPERLSCGGEAIEFFNRGAEGAPPRAEAEGKLPLVKPQGNLVQVLGREVRHQKN